MAQHGFSEKLKSCSTQNIEKWYIEKQYIEKRYFVCIAKHVVGHGMNRSSACRLWGLSFTVFQAFNILVFLKYKTLLFMFITCRYN